jgi:broad specificity phosphatase PhoE
MRAIIVRHYKTISNEADQILGWGDAPPAENWKDDLNHVDEILIRSKLNIQMIYTSTLNRARNTGQFYADSFSISDVNDTPALKEVNYGNLYNKSKKWVEKHVPLYKKDPDLIYPNGESFRQMQNRRVLFIKSLTKEYPDATILIVVHAGVIRGFISHFLGLDYSSNLKRRIGHQYIGDFTFENEQCIRYDELGKPSGFIKDGSIKVPLYRQHRTSK